MVEVPAFVQYTQCLGCGGTGKVGIVKRPCPWCSGKGKLPVCDNSGSWEKNKKWKTTKEDGER